MAHQLLDIRRGKARDVGHDGFHVQVGTLHGVAGDAQVFHRGPVFLRGLALVIELGEALVGMLGVGRGRVVLEAGVVVGHLIDVEAQVDVAVERSFLFRVGTRDDGGRGKHEHVEVGRLRIDAVSVEHLA